MAASAFAPIDQSSFELSATLSPRCGPAEAWIGSRTDGVACLDAGGWKLFDEAKPYPGHGYIHDIAVCRNGMTWVASSSGLLSTNGRTWTNHSKATKAKDFEAVACDAKGRAWLAGYGIVASFDGTKMTTYGVSKLGTGQFIKLLQDIAVAPDGHVWVVTSNSVATFDGSAWRYFEEGKGFDKNYFLEALTVDSHGKVWVATSTEGLLTYDGQSWTIESPDDFAMIRSLAVDGSDRIWAGTFSSGVSVFDGQSWITYDRSNSPLPSNRVTSIATDTRGRAWIGTEWGLAVLSGTDWRVYRVDDSNIPDNVVASLAVFKGGPELPANVTKKPGALAGRIVRSGSPQAGLTVEVCVEDLGTMFSGSSPCSAQPFHQATQTAADGSFRFGLPAGKYAITVQTADGKWHMLSSQFGIRSSMQEVKPGKTTTVGDMDLAKAK